MVLGRDVLLEVLRTEGVCHLFGNPGSTELPLIDALADADDLDYVLALQEATVVGMADGYAQATGRPAFVNLHTVGRARQRHRQPHQRPGQPHAAGGHRRASRTTATWSPTRCCRGRWWSSPEAP